MDILVTEFHQQPQMFLLSRSEDLSLKNIKTTPTWGRSILQRLGFRRRVATTGKVKFPEGARKEAGLQHHF